MRSHRRKSGDKLLLESFGYPYIFGKEEAYAEVIYDRARNVVDHNGTVEFIEWITENFTITRKTKKNGNQNRKRK